MRKDAERVLTEATKSITKSLSVIEKIEKDIKTKQTEAEKLAERKEKALLEDNEKDYIQASKELVEINAKIDFMRASARKKRESMDCENLLDQVTENIHTMRIGIMEDLEKAVIQKMTEIESLTEKADAELKEMTERLKDLYAVSNMLDSHNYAMNMGLNASANSFRNYIVFDLLRHYYQYLNRTGKDTESKKGLLFTNE